MFEVLRSEAIELTLSPLVIFNSHFSLISEGLKKKSCALI